jgi:hypothetical protein
MKQPAAGIARGNRRRAAANRAERKKTTLALAQPAVLFPRSFSRYFSP